MKAPVITETRTAEVVDIKEQSTRPDYARIKTVALALNPTDYHHTASAGKVGGILGYDVSGIVVDIGDSCKTDVKKGDKVWAICHCANNENQEDGAYAEFAMIKDGYLAKIPDTLSFEQAATLGVGVTTVGQALYMILKFPLPVTEPSEEPVPILIYGGSTATGTLAIQYAKLSGLKVLTTCSPNNFELVKSLAADAVFDYHDPNCAEIIRAFTNDSLYHVLDTISQESSFKLCAGALSSDSSKHELHCVALLPVDAWPRKDVNARAILAYTTFGEAFFKSGTNYPPLKDHYDFGVMFWKLSAKLLAEGKIKPHPVTIREKGLNGIPEGIVDVAEGKVSATTLVYRTADTLGLNGTVEATA